MPQSILRLGPPSFPTRAATGPVRSTLPQRRLRLYAEAILSDSASTRNGESLLTNRIVAFARPTAPT